MRDIAPEADIVITRTNAVPPFGADRVSEVVALALKLTGQNETHGVSYATEAGLFQDAGSPAVVCGPGDIAQAHTADEWIAESEIAKVHGLPRAPGGLGLRVSLDRSQFRQGKQ